MIYLLSLVTSISIPKNKRCNKVTQLTFSNIYRILYHYQAAGFNFSTSYRRSGLDGIWGRGNRNGLLCNLSPIDQVQLTAHPHKYIQRIWIVLDMQMTCWVKPVGERWRSEKKQESHPFLLHLLHICQDLVLKKSIEEGVKHYAKQQIVPRWFHLKRLALLLGSSPSCFLCRLSDAVSMFT